MIRIQRDPTPPEIDVFTAKTYEVDGEFFTRAELERAQAIEFFEDLVNYADGAKLNTRKFTFNVYRDPKLKVEMERIFGNKCAYCESDFGHVTPGDVEHFRPKLEIRTPQGSIKPGYYWLAGEWENLLTACPKCNRPQKNQRLPGQPPGIAPGKGAQFPLAQETHRLRTPSQAIEDEEQDRLLINPCLDDPEEHLTYTDDGLVLPKPNAHGKPSEKGQLSIVVYALQRKLLVDRRKTTLNALVDKVDELRVAITDYNVYRSLDRAVDVARKKNQIVAIKLAIKKLLAADAPYLGILRDWIRRQEEGGHLADLKAAGVDLVSYT